MTDRLEVKAEVTIDDAGTITGIAWPFGAPDSVGDVIEPGAFAFATHVPILMEHDQSRVVGVWTTHTETERALEVKGNLFVDGVGPAREARDDLRARRFSGLSIGYRLHEAKSRPEGGRTLTRLTVTEISLCRRPVNPAARILEVKAHKEDPMEPQTAPETKSDPVISKFDLEALKADVSSRLDKIEAKAQRITADNTPAGENDNGERKAFGTFLRHGADNMGADERKALTVSDNANGGYLAPQDFGAEILKKIVELSPIRSYARVTTIAAAEIVYPRKLTGSSATWVSEIGQRTESGMTFEQATFKPHELATWIPVSNQLLEDNAYGLESELLTDFAESFARKEGTAFVSGDGNGKPQGVLTAAGIAEVKTGAAGTLGTDPAATIIGMFHSVPSVVAQSGVWLMNRKTLGALRTLKDSTGRFIMIDPITAGAPLTLLGRPIVEAIDMPDIAAGAFPILFGDLSGYRIVDRIGLSILRDPFTLSGTGQVKFTARRRVGGDVSHTDRFLKLKVAA